MTHPKSTPTIPITEIEIGTRFRKEYGDLTQLSYSINKHGLINPVAVGVAEMMNIPRETSRPYILLAGGRRMAALTSLDWTSIPVRVYDQPLSEQDYRAIELAENFDRKDMDYQEELALKLELNRLQKELHGEKIGKSPTAPGWSNADTARLLKESPATLSSDLKLAEAMERFPELNLDKCKNKSEALKRLKSVGKIITSSEAAKAYTNEIGPSDKLFRKLSSSYIIGDCFETMAKIPDSSMSIVEIDPPYAIDLHKVKKDNECIGYNEIDAAVYSSFMSRLFTECYRILRPNSWMVCWFAQDPWFQTIASAIQDAGFKMNLIPAIWAKSQGQTAQPETFLGNSYEAFFYARKGQPKLNKPGRSNIFQFPTVAHTKKYHPTQRPIELMEELLTTFSPPGGVGFVPFLGSGVTLLAGHNCQMSMVGTDLSQQFKDGYILQLKEILNHD